MIDFRIRNSACKDNTFLARIIRIMPFFFNFVPDYVDYCNNIGLFCSVAVHQQTDWATGYERDFFQGKSSFALVYGSLWYGGCFNIGCDVCECAWYGDDIGNDVYADVFGLYFGLCGGCFFTFAALLQVKLDNYLFVFGTAIGTKGI